MQEYSVYVHKIDGDLDSEILNALEFISWKNYVRKDSKVFLKPNFTFPFYKRGITTSPEFINSLLKILKKRADNIILGESDGGNNTFKADDAFIGHNMPTICRESGVELINLSKQSSSFIEDEIQGKNVKVQLPNLLLHDVDCLISLPVLKVHVMTNVTLSMKNLWGCNPDPMRCLHHKDLSRKLTLITKILNPKISLMDGIYALDGHGPMYGTPKKLDLILSSNNPVTIDSLGTRIMGFNPKNVEHILFAEKEDLGTTDIGNIKINEKWEKFKMQFNLNKTFIDRLSWFLFESESMAKLVMDSPITPIIYKFAHYLRSSDEKKIADEINKYC